MSENIIIRPQTQFNKTTYQVEWWIDLNGEKIRKRKSFKNQYQAENKKNEILTERVTQSAKDALRARGVRFDSGEDRKFISKSIQDALELFYENLKITVFDVRHLRREKLIINQFGGFIIDERGRQTVDEITLEDLEQFRKNMLSRKLAPSTVERCFNNIRSFLNYCVSHKFREDNPAKFLKRLHVKIPTIQPWSEHYEEIELALPEWASEFLVVLEDTMCRPIELCRAQVKHIDWEERTITLISGKGNVVSERRVPLTDRVFTTLRAVVAKRKLEKRGDPDDLVFRNSKGNPVKTEIFDKAIRKARRALNLPEYIKAYAVRHEGLTQLKRLKVAMADIGALAGHKKIETTKRYTASDMKDLRNVINIADAAKKKQA